MMERHRASTCQSPLLGVRAMRSGSRNETAPLRGDDDAVHPFDKSPGSLESQTPCGKPQPPPPYPGSGCFPLQHRGRVVSLLGVHHDTVGEPSSCRGASRELSSRLPGSRPVPHADALRLFATEAGTRSHYSQSSGVRRSGLAAGGRHLARSAAILGQRVALDLPGRAATGARSSQAEHDGVVDVDSMARLFA